MFGEIPPQGSPRFCSFHAKRYGLVVASFFHSVSTGLSTGFAAAIDDESGLGSDIEVLAIGNCLLRKEEQDPALRQDYKVAFELD